MLKKVLGAGVIVTLVAVVLVGVGATTASAQSTSLCQTVDLLVAAGVIAPDKVATAKAAAGCTAAAPAAYTFTRNLTVGSTGADVTALQTKLGVSPATGYFGAITKAAVVAYQTANGIAGTGYVGPLTLAKLNVAAPATPATPATPGTPGTPATPGLEGGAGSATFSTTTTDVESTVNEGANNTKVLGFKVEAEDSDVSVTNLKVTLQNTVTDESTKIDRYLDSVSVYMGSEKVGEADIEDFTKTGTSYSKNIALSDAIVKEGSANKKTFYVTVDALSSIDSANRTADTVVTVSNFRYVDGAGVNTTDSTTVTETFGYSTLAASGDVKVVVSKGSASPLAGTVDVSDTSSTKDVLMLEFKIKATGSDISFDTLNITTTEGTASSLGAVVSRLVLMKGSDELATIDGADLDGTDTFDLDDTYTIEAGDTDTFRIYADINDADNFTIDSVVTGNLLVSFASFSPEDDNGDTITDTGSAAGTVQTFMVDAASVSGYRWTVPSSGTIVDFFFTVEAQDEAYDVLASSVADTAAGTATITDTSSTPETTTKGILSAYSGDDVTAIGSTGFTVAAGDTATFRVRYSVEGATNGLWKEVKITSVAGVSVPTASQTSPTATITIN